MRFAVTAAFCLSLAAFAQVAQPRELERPPMPPPAQCQADADCGMTQQSCCPGCCRAPSMVAMPSKEIPKHQLECQTMRCAAPDCSAVVCPPDAVQGPMHAECQQGRCVGVNGPKPECRADTDCTMSSFAGCCGSCCPVAPHPISVQKLKDEQARCAVIDCAPLGCGRVNCPAIKREPVRPVCRAGQCTAEALGAAECRADGDCELAIPPDAACRSSPCGCCPGAEVAMPVGRPHIMEEPPPPRKQPQPQKGDPKFGLSAGNSGGASPPPQCSPCPSVRPSRAACRDGKCFKAPVMMTK